MKGREVEQMEPTEKITRQQLEQGADEGRAGHGQVQAAKGKWGGNTESSKPSATDNSRAGEWVWCLESVCCPSRVLLRGALQVGQMVVSFSLSQNKY